MLMGNVGLIYICWTTNQVYIVINLSQVFIRKDSSVGSFTEFFFLLVCDDILLASDFYISFHSSSLFLSNWGKLNVSHSFHYNFFSFLITHELTYINRTAMFTASWVQLRLEWLLCDTWISSRTNLLGWNVWQKPKYKLCVIILITHVSTLLRWDVKWFNLIPAFETKRSRRGTPLATKIYLPPPLSGCAART